MRNYIQIFGWRICELDPMSLLATTGSNSCSKSKCSASQYGSHSTYPRSANQLLTSSDTELSWTAPSARPTDKRSSARTLSHSSPGGEDSIIFSVSPGSLIRLNSWCSLFWLLWMYLYSPVRTAIIASSGLTPSPNRDRWDSSEIV